MDLTSELPLDALILRRLFEKRDEFVHPSQLLPSPSLGEKEVHSRIAALIRCGYPIDRSAPLGYRLSHSPDLLYPDEIMGRLSPDARRLLAQNVLVLKETRSTMDIAVREGITHEGRGLLVVAERQTAGRGRQGRVWESETSAGLYFSMILKPEWPLRLWHQLTLIACLAAAESLEAMAQQTFRIKWPNDLMMGRKKIAGILTEIHSHPSAPPFAVLGMGLNVNHRQEDFGPLTRDLATSLHLATGREWRRADLLLSILESFTRRLETPFDVIRQEWSERCFSIGERLRIQTTQGVREGQALGLDENGALLLRLEGGRIEPIYSGLLQEI